MTREHIEFVINEYSTDTLADKLLELFDEEAASYQHTINKLNKTLSKNKGHWEDGNNICPKCGEDKFKGLEADIYADWQPNFCPNCGADMRGEGT